MVPMDWAMCPHIIGHQWHMSFPDSTTINQWKRAMSSTWHIIVRMVQPCHVIVRTLQTGTVSIKIFACLAWRTDCDIFSIQTPFEKVNIPPESGRRDGRNGTVFVAFRALWILSKIWSLDHYNNWKITMLLLKTSLRATQRGSVIYKHVSLVSLSYLMTILQNLTYKLL